MTSEPYKRPRRNPLSSEEVANIIAHKKKKELVELRKLKKSKTYKLLNVFNILSMFIYLEILFCFFGPCHYETRTSINTVQHYGPGSVSAAKPFINSLDIYEAGKPLYKFMIENYLPSQPKKIQFVIGKDFLLQKELKGSLKESDEAYRLFAASPLLFLCGLMSFFSVFVFVLDLNEKVYTLFSLSTLNFLTLLAILCI
ncbi:hypothetical protein CNR22_22175 [Sphingobacteriaceae bacterium]|nr:hypothetical protein CNR22_22175 [Sphingobacteriaceae bacterium]